MAAVEADAATEFTTVFEMVALRVKQFYEPGAPLVPVTPSLI